MKTREHASWFDFSIAAISPVLIMGLVGSLAFFLLDVLYGGQYEGRLQWTLFFFVVGAVLVARIAVVIDPGRAKLYGLALGGVVFLSTLRFVDYQHEGALAAVGWLINLIIILIVFWSANRLVWNCTYLDEHADDPGRGLLSDLANPAKPVEQGSGDPAEPRTGTPGSSVILFTLAAFPLFGLGQSLIPLDDHSRRRHAFLLMLIYVACGMGLLCTTALLGLRRYLRRRRLTMPAPMAGLWLAIGAGLIAALLGVCAVLPRPHAEYPLIAWKRIGSSEAAASKVGQGDASGQGEGRPGAKGDAEGAKSGRGRGQAGGSQAGKSGTPEGGPGSGDKGSGSTSGRAGDKSGGERGQSGSDTSPSATAVTPQSLADAVSAVLKWVVLLLIGIPIALFALWYLLRRMSSLPDWLARLLDALTAWWQSLFGRVPAPSEEPEPVAPAPRRRAFHEYSNPFADGTAARRSPNDLVRYSFAALETWAGESGDERGPNETPLEFAERIGRQVDDLREPARRLARHYAGLAYGRRSVPDSARRDLERLWQVLQSAEPAPIESE